MVNTSLRNQFYLWCVYKQGKEGLIPLSPAVIELPFQRRNIRFQLLYYRAGVAAVPGVNAASVCSQHRNRRIRCDALRGGLYSGLLRTFNVHTFLFLCRGNFQKVIF